MESQQCHAIDHGTQRQTEGEENALGIPGCLMVTQPHMSEGCTSL
jgi:hypothetical protein